MKKLIIFVLLIFLCVVSGCSNNSYNKTSSFKELSKVVYPNNEKENAELSIDYVKKVNDTYFKIVNHIYDENVNFVYSPVSLYMTLSMLSEGATGDSYDELARFLNIDSLEESRMVNKKLFKNNYYKNKEGMTRIANSLWIKNDYLVNDEYIKTLEKDYYSETFNIDFTSREDQENVRKWINKNTNNFLGLNKDNYPIDSKLVSMIINTLYFNNKWEDEFKKTNNYYDKFNNNREVEYMTHSVNSSYYEGDGFKACYDYFKNENKVLYILPNEGEKVSDYLTLDFTNLKMSYSNISLHVPKFDYQSNFPLLEALDKLNVKSIKYGGLGKINTGMVISDIHQTARIKFSEEGVEAAAVTRADSCKSVAEQRMFILNRPFVYYILDSNNVILFAGVVNNL